MNRHYFGGLKVQPATVFELRPTSFAQLIEEKFNVPVQIQMTRAEYQALDADEQFKTKNVPYMLAVSMEEGETHRCDANAHMLEAAFLDIDDETQARNFFESPQEVLEALFPWNAVIHTTASHTPEKPRVRVMLDCHAATTRHKDVIAFMVELLGLPHNFKGARESNVLSQPFFFPCQFAEEEGSPILASRTNGRTLTDPDIPVRTLKEGETPDRLYAYEGDSEAGDLAYLPAADLSVEDIREPLMAIDPDVTYGTWTMIASALRHQFREEEQAREAYEMFDEWSQGGTKYKNSADTYAKWKSFKPDAVGKVPRTIKSLFKFSIDAGWKPDKVANKLKFNIEEWIAKCDSADDLYSYGPRHIADLPFKTQMIEEALMNTLRDRIKVVTGKKPPSMEALKRDVGNARFKARQQAQPDDKPQWLRRWCYCSTENEFCNVVTGIKMAPAAFDNTFSSELMPDAEEEAKSGIPTILPTRFALNVKKIKKVEGYIYDPRQTEASPLEPFFTLNGVEYLNTFRTSSQPKLEPKLAKWAETVVMNHLRTIIAEEEYCMILLYWIATLVQYPGRKIGWSPVIQGAQGCGKTILFNLIEAALGRDNVSSVNPNTIKQSWNDWGFGKQCVSVEEMRVHGHSRADIMNALKDLITNELVTINKRNTDAVAGLNLTNFIGFTNYVDALYMEEDDRRYMFIRSCIDSEAKVAAMKARNHFAEIIDLFKNHGGALRAFLLEVKIPEDFLAQKNAPRTKYRSDAIFESKSRLQESIEDAITGDNKLIGADIIHMEELKSVVGEPGNNHPPSHYLAAMNYVRYSNGDRFSIAGVRTAIWVHRDLYDPLFGDADEILRERLPELF